MKNILLSIKPKYVEMILNGEKTIEIRKSCPKETPFKVYVYCTKEKKQDDIIWADLFADRGKMNRKVVAEFICDKVDTINEETDGFNIVMFYDDIKRYGCITDLELKNYLGNAKSIHALHISDLKIYDKPKELGEFRKHCEWAYTESPARCYPVNCEMCPWNTITRPPQSWQYVEEIKDEV